MMALVRVVFELGTGKNDVEPAMKKVGKAAKDTSKAVKDTGDESKKAEKKTDDFCKSFSRGLGDVHHAIRIAHELFRAFSEFVRPIGESIQRALDFRFNDDAGKRQVLALEAALKDTQAQIGDKFIPLLQGIDDVMRPALKSFDKWLEVNKQLIESGIIEWAVKLSVALVRGVSIAVLGVMANWIEWKLLIYTVADLALKFVGDMGNALGWVSGKLADMFHAFGGDLYGLAASKLDRLAKSAKDMGGYFAFAGEAGRKQIEDEIKARDQQYASIMKVSDALVKGIEEAGAAAMGHLDDKVHRAHRSVDELQKDAKAWEAIEQKQKAAEDKLDAEQTRIFIDQLKRKEDLAKAYFDRENTRRELANETEVQMGQRMLDAQDAFAHSFADTFTQAFISGFESVGDLFKQLLAHLASMLIGSIFLKLFTSIFKGILGAGGIGLASLFGFSQGGPVSRAFPGYALGGPVLPRYAGGGMVEGPDGQDSIIARVMRKEYILPPWLTDSIKRDQLPARQSIAPSSPQQIVHYHEGDTHNHFGFVVPPSDTDMDRITARIIQPSINRNRRRGIE